MNLTKFIHTKKIKQFNSISKTLLTIATCYCNLGKINKVICFLHKCFSLGKSYISLTNNFSVDIILLDNEVVL